MSLLNLLLGCVGETSTPSAPLPGTFVHEVETFDTLKSARLHAIRPGSRLRSGLTAAALGWKAVQETAGWDELR
ncbi:MAG: hypothetical protein AAFV53_41515 [Myxococcota bacterium]